MCRMLIRLNRESHPGVWGRTVAVQYTVPAWRWHFGFRQEAQPVTLKEHSAFLSMIDFGF